VADFDQNNRPTSPEYAKLDSAVAREATGVLHSRQNFAPLGNSL
jgi:hypothetical protein